MQRRWILPETPDERQALRLAGDLGISELLAVLLTGRGITDPEEASRFLDPRLANLQPPEQIPGIHKAAERIVQALLSGERIALYGDYDVDGLTSLAILRRFLDAAGGQISCFVPERSIEGYGLSSKGIQRCLEESNPALLVAVDCGTNSLDEARLLKELGCDLLILDHHEPGETLASEACHALVNPKLGKDFHYLCSAGLAFKLCHALQKLHPVPGCDLREYLDLVAVGTVADIVPLVGENRIFVRAGTQATLPLPLVRLAGTAPSGWSYPSLYPLRYRI